MTKLSAWKMAGAVLVLCAVTAIVSPAQTFDTVFNFDGTDGYYPFYVTLVQGADGKFYGTTSETGPGTVFGVTAGGGLTTSRFNQYDGSWPYAGVVLGTDGNFYGTTYYGGNSSFCDDDTDFGCGVVFKFTPEGSLTQLYSFCAQTNCTDGIKPVAGLIQASDGNFYGTTNGARFACGSDNNICGTVFKLTPQGTLTTLHTFCTQTAPTF